MKKIIIALVVLLGAIMLPELLSESKVVEAAEKTMYVNAKGDIILRDKPSKDAKKIDTIKNKSEVKVVSTSKGWSYIKVGSKKGYVFASALSATNPNIPVVRGGLSPKVGLKLAYFPDIHEDNKFSTYNVKYYGSGTDLLYLSDNDNWGSYYIYGESKRDFSIVLCDCDWTLVNFEYPLIQGKYTIEYIEVNGEDGMELKKRKMLVESTSATVKVKGGTFKNVVILKDADGMRYYFAPGMGLIKLVVKSGDVIFELYSVK